VIFGTGKGVMRLLTLADGRTELLPFGLFDEEGYTLRELPRASWSGPGAFTYVKRVGARSEFILRNGASEVVLSRNWPDAVVYGLLANPPDNPLPGVSR
jgi:hypothetical protein